MTGIALRLRSAQSPPDALPPNPVAGETARRNAREVRLPIAGASAAVAMHPQTLRKYERAGLLRPARRSGGARHYSADDIVRLALIKRLAEVRRINIAGMALTLALHDELASLLEEIEGMDAEVAVKRAREQVAAMIAMIAEGGPEAGE